MKIGIIGAGAIGKKHADAIRAAGDEVAWVVDTNTELGEALAAEHDAQHSLAADPLWADDSVDAVIVGVPNWLHAPLAIESLRAGKDVLVEKPMALNLAECEQIAAVVDETQRLLQIGFVHRFTSVAVKSKEIIDAGKLGDIYYAQALLHLRRGVPGLGRWFTDKKLSGGGTLIDVGVHLIDLSLHLLGFPEVREVTGQTFSNFGVRMGDYHFEEMWSGPPNLEGKCDVEDAAHALVRFANGTVLDLHVAWAGNYPSKFLPTSCVTLCGTEAGLSFELFGSEVQLTSEQAGKVVDETLAVEENDFFLDQYLDFKTAVASRQVRQANPQQACVTQSIVDAIYRSSQLGQNVDLTTQPADAAAS